MPSAKVCGKPHTAPSTVTIAYFQPEESNGDDEVDLSLMAQLTQKLSGLETRGADWTGRGSAFSYCQGARLAFDEQAGG